MPKCVFIRLLLSLAVVGSTLGSSPTLAQVAVDRPTAGTTSVAPVVPGVAANLAIIQQLLDSAGQLEQSALSAGSSNLSANIGRLTPSTSTTSGGAGSGGSSSTGSTGR